MVSSQNQKPKPRALTSYLYEKSELERSYLYEKSELERVFNTPIPADDIVTIFNFLFPEEEINLNDLMEITGKDYATIGGAKGSKKYKGGTIQQTRTIQKTRIFCILLLLSFLYTAFKAFDLDRVNCFTIYAPLVYFFRTPVQNAYCKILTRLVHNDIMPLIEKVATVENIPALFAAILAVRAACGAATTNIGRAIRVADQLKTYIDVIFNGITEPPALPQQPPALPQQPPTLPQPPPALPQRDPDEDPSPESPGGGSKTKTKTKTKSKTKAKTKSKPKQKN